MKSVRTGARRSNFDVLIDSRDAQAAMMTLQSRQSSSDEVSNEHPASEQWLYVIAGVGTATVVARSKKTRTLKEHSVKIRAGTLLLIEKGERHRIQNTGRRPLRTINFYIPKAYRADGTVAK